MYTLAIILFGLFSTSVGVLLEEVAVDGDLRMAIEAFESIERNGKIEYDKVRADFLKYNEPAMVLLAELNKTYYDQINESLKKSEDELIVPGVPVFSECTDIYDRLTVIANSMKKVLNNCTSKYVTRNTDYLRNLDERWLAIRRDVDASKTFQTELAQRRKGGIELEISDEDLLNYKKDTAKDTREALNNQIAEALKKPDWAVDSMVKTELDICLSKLSFLPFRLRFAELLGTLRSCVLSRTST